MLLSESVVRTQWPHKRNLVNAPPEHFIPQSRVVHSRCHILHRRQARRLLEEYEVGLGRIMPIDSPALNIQPDGFLLVISLHRLGYSPDCRVFTVEVASFLRKRMQGVPSWPGTFSASSGPSILRHPGPFAQDGRFDLRDSVLPNGGDQRRLRRGAVGFPLKRNLETKLLFFLCSDATGPASDQGTDREQRLYACTDA